MTATLNFSFSIPMFTDRGECEYVIDTPEGEVMEDCVEFDFDNSTFHSTFTSEVGLCVCVCMCVCVCNNNNNNDRFSFIYFITAAVRLKI